jgi:hypothetical protein
MTLEGSTERRVEVRQPSPAGEFAEPPRGRRQYPGTNRLYAINLPSDFEPVAPDRFPAFDLLFQSGEADAWVAVVVDAVAHPLDALDEVVVRNARDASESVEVLSTRSVPLGAAPNTIAAHRTELRLEPRAGLELYMLNTHGATPYHSYQVVVWGRIENEERLRELIRTLESSGFDFGRSVRSLGSNADDASTTPVRPDSPAESTEDPGEDPDTADESGAASDE